MCEASGTQCTYTCTDNCACIITHHALFLIVMQAVVIVVLHDIIAPFTHTSLSTIICLHEASLS